jgi:hypothetical protein
MHFIQFILLDVLPNKLVIHVLYSKNVNIIGRLKSVLSGFFLNKIKSEKSFKGLCVSPIVASQVNSTQVSYQDQGFFPSYRFDSFSFPL